MLLGLVEDLEDPLSRGDRALRLADPHAEHPQRHDEHREQEVEREEVAERERARHDHPAGDEEDRGLREQWHQRQQGDVQRTLPVGRDGLPEDGVGRVGEPLLPVLFLSEGLDDVHADDALLGDRRDVGELLLDVAQDRMRDVAVAIGDEHDRGRDRERDQRELPAVEEQDDAHDHDRHDVLGEEDEPVAEEEAHGLEVDRRPRHQLSRLAAVVEAEREPEEVRVELVAEVVLDAEGLLAGDESPPEHAGGADDSEREDHRDPEREHARVGVARNLVDDDPGQDGDEDAGDLGADRQERGHHERGPVRPQEPEQAQERAPVRSPSRLGVPLVRHLTVGYGSCWRPCRTSPRGATRRRSRRSGRPSPRLRGCSTSTRTRITTGPCSPSRETPTASWTSLLAGIATACSLIDLRRHDGVHPRVGAADVVPLVALRPDQVDDAASAALDLAARIGSELGLPVFLYGEVGAGRRPAFFRRGGLDELERRLDAGEITPDFGPTRIDPRSGAVLVGARKPLVAYNLDLATDDVGVAKAVAAAVRESSGGLPGVQAIGLELPRSGRVQVSMNVLDVERSPLHVVVEAVRREAATRSTRVAGGELVGLVPAGVLEAAEEAGVEIPDVDESHVLERRLGSRLRPCRGRSS